MYSFKSDMKLFANYFKSISQTFLDKRNINKCKKVNSFTETILIPEGAKYIGSEFLGQKKVNNYISTIYKIERENEGECFYTSYVYKKGLTQVLITDDWESLNKLFAKIDLINSPVVVELNGSVNQEGGIKNGRKTKFGRKRF